jgi:excisionase family DNA binding protein
MATKIVHAERLVKPSDVARSLGVHHNTVLSWIREGRIPHVKTPTGRYLLPWTLVMQSLSGTYDLSLPVSDDAPSEEETIARLRRS